MLRSVRVAFTSYFMLSVLFRYIDPHYEARAQCLQDIQFHGCV